MGRKTRLLEISNIYIVDEDQIQHVDNGYQGMIVNELAKYENMMEYLINTNNEIAKELERLRSEEKTKTVKFKQLLANKLVNSNIILMAESFGIQKGL